MKKNFFKSLAAIVAGFILGAILSVAADFLMNSLGVIQLTNFKASSIPVLCLVILYRFIFNTIGCYITAKLAPNKPMKHVLIIGFIGTLISILGSLVMWDQAIAFYNISIILISLPSAWLGGKLFLKKQNGQTTQQA